MSKPVILCVDDEKIVLNGLKEQLKRALGNDYSVETAEGGDDALEILDELLEDNYEIPVVIADYIMPDMKGDELLKRIHEISPKTLKIMLTGQASTEGVTNAVNYASLYRYMGKPWQQDDLILTVTEAIRSYFQEKQLEEQNKKLRESEEKFRSIFENAIEGIFQSTIDGRFLSVNPAMAYYLGFDSPDDLMQNITDIKKQLYVIPERRDELICHIKEQEIVRGFEVQQYCKDGTKIWASLDVHPILDRNGNILFIEGMFEDVTKQKQAEEDLNRANEKRRELERIINHSPVVVFLIKNAPGWPVEFVSENVSQFGYTPDNFTSGLLDFSKIIHPEDLSRVTAEIKHHGSEGRREFSQEYRILAKSGDVRWTDDHFWIRRDDKGNITHYQGIVLDISVRKEKEKAEIEREIAEAANMKIMDSIRYAKMIQSSLLPNPDDLKTYLSRSFLIWTPKDIVGGDFIFTDYCPPVSPPDWGGSLILAVIDCTGHGVPGAFMTTIASSGLRRIVRDECCHDPGEILEKLNFFVKNTLQQDTEHALSDDGLDAAICLISGQSSLFEGHSDNGDQSAHGQLIFAGARLPLYYIQDNTLNLIKGDRMSIGYKRSDLSFKYSNHTVKIEKGMSFYMFSDGFIDQLGGKKGIRYGSRRFKELLTENSAKPFGEQKELLLKSFEDHKGKNERQDDVTVVGFGF
ncbi:MAG: PAS domain S-box protein [Desulfobacterales bacterium]|nr:PAS domain S-box protein [Desulfobacterales bacterium]